MTETYTSGTWRVKAGAEDAFVAEWTSFVRWATEMPGSGTFRLVRDVDEPGVYMSFAPWESFESQRDWSSSRSSGPADSGRREAAIYFWSPLKSPWSMMWRASAR